MLTRKIYLILIPTFLITMGLLVYGVYFTDAKREQMLEDWGKLILELERNTAGYRPPVAARMYAYINLGAYMAGTGAGDPQDALCTLQESMHSGLVDDSGLDAGLAVNSCLARLCELFFTTAPPDQIRLIKELESRYRSNLGSRLDKESKMRSVSFGLVTAHKVWTYSTTDSAGHDAFLFNYDERYAAPECPICWQKTGERLMPALLPRWGKVRSFVTHPGAVSLKPPPPFTEDPNNEYFRQANEVILIQSQLSNEERWIADFWSDDRAGMTMTPPGRWFSIAFQAADQSGLSFLDRLRLNLHLGAALHDAAIRVWEGKYEYSILRPETFIKRHLALDWFPYISSPTFPTYPSGHAAFGAVSEVVLTEWFGDDYVLTDRTHQARREFKGAPRQFHSFREMAIENAWSRLLAGVHFRMDCDAGMDLGYQVGAIYKSKGILPGGKTSDRRTSMSGASAFPILSKFF